MGELEGVKMILAVSGGIAAYKAADLCSQLRKAGAQVRVAMTASAVKFVGPLTFETLSNNPVYSSIFDQPKAWEMEHISWAKWGDLMLVAPASANVIARMANGFADDPVTALYLAFPNQVIIAPAMNTQMLQHPATAHNLQVLQSRGVAIVEPESGILACGDVGPGRLAQVSSIMEFLRKFDFQPGGTRIETPENDHDQETNEAEGAFVETQTPVQAAMQGLAGAEMPGRDDTLAGRTILVTSGPTHEYLDPVRFLTNPSSGKMGAAIAREAARRSATVHLVSGPVAGSALPSDVAKIHKVTTAEQMLRTVRNLASAVDIFIFAAAVSDFRAANPPTQKIKRTGNSLALPLVENPDIAQAISYGKRPGQITVGFAAETNDLETQALAKLARKHLDAIVANDVTNPRIGFDSEENEVTIFLRDGTRISVSRRSKGDVAREIFDAILRLQSAGPAAPVPINDGM